MWQRLKRLFRAIFGGAIDAVSDPKLILEQNIRDMRDKLPHMNEGIAKANAGIIRLEHEAHDYKELIAKLTARVKACLLGGDEGMAGQYAVQLKQNQEALERNQGQLSQAQQGLEALNKLKEKYMREMKMKTEEAQAAIKDADAAKWKNELADVFETFEVAGVDSTHQEMLEKLKEKSAMAEGRLATAAGSVDMKTIAMEEKAEQLEGAELLKQFKLDLGMGNSESAPSSSAPARQPIKTI